MEVDGQVHELHLRQGISMAHARAVAAALARALELNTDIQHALSDAARFIPEEGQLNSRIGYRGARILDGSYDMTADDMVEALAALKQIPGRRKIALLGGCSDAALGKKAGQCAHITILVGGDTEPAREAALAHGSDVHQLPTSKEAGQWLAEYLQTGDLVLVAGPKEYHLNEAVAELIP